ncbi:NUDIX domain-containing protein [Desulfotignum balticum]|uniref:NUDIX domain-containing protein n=1 Tax=Desulfotignum balticum TaxID=115781 RepID=UPI00042A8F4B|nr:NUDIX domain-containing protein [Desulfotignum balticum]
MSIPLKWEFPGGEIKPGETSEHCRCREIAGELAVQVPVYHTLVQGTHAYPDFTITLREHAAVVWKAGS